MPLNARVLPGLCDRRHLEVAARRRHLLVGFVGVILAMSAAVLATVSADGGFTAIEGLTFALFVLNLAWIATWFFTFAVGFWLTLSQRDPWTLDKRSVSTTSSPLICRTAIALPICHEDVTRVIERVSATWTSLQATGSAAAFDVFVLSDSNDPDIVYAEEALLVPALTRLAPGQFFYRRRASNVGRKAGNILEFLGRWGGRYDFMVVLDADSIMSGARLVSLVTRLQESPRVGILQTVPMACGRQSLFGRCVQFAIRLNGPLLARGLSFLQLGEGNYWGHNAVLRVDAFCDHAGFLPLPGKAPLGGDILSHDFVEAALVLRAGYSVWLDTDVGGSWEEVPAHLDGWAARDRRWCQGSLQHLSVFFSAGFRGASRVHILGGVASYLSSLSWLLLLTMASVDAIHRATTPVRYFVVGNPLPLWPIDRFDETALLVALPLTLLLAPQLLSVVAALRERGQWGGAVPLVVSSAFTLLFAVVLAPVSMIIHSVFVTKTLLGRAITWGRQHRDDEALPWRAGARTAALPTVVGVAWTAAMTAFAPDAVLWLAPVLVSLVLAWPFAVLTSYPRFGLALRAKRLLTIPEELEAPLELRVSTTAATTPSLARPMSHMTPVPAPRLVPLHRLGRAGRTPPVPPIEPATPIDLLERGVST